LTNRLTALLKTGAAGVLLLAGSACSPANGAGEPVAAAAQSLASARTRVPTADLLPSTTPSRVPDTTSTRPPTRTHTATPTPTATPTLTSTPTHTPTPSLTDLILVTNTPRASATSTVTATSTASATATATVVLLPSFTPTPGGPTWTPPPADPASQIADHYYLSRPVADGLANWVARTYPYGSTSGGRLQVHHGVDIVNPTGTEVLAAAAGTVIYAGDDLSVLFGPINNYYGNLVVIQHPFTDADGSPVFTLYGHLANVFVQTGQTVNEGDSIGEIGGTGVALGPHLHFEVRVGDAYSFDATRNPDLWIRPYFEYGTLVGRIVDMTGALLYDATIMVDDGETLRYAFSYADTSVNGDTVFGENYTLGDLPKGYYTVTVSENGRIRFREVIYVYPNRSTWLTIQLQ
jgi:murein DD-endopeptidase MepM/ murein hydrolase activator NlpD